MNPGSLVFFVCACAIHYFRLDYPVARRRPLYWVSGPRIWALILDVFRAHADVQETYLRMSVLVGKCIYTCELQSWSARVEEQDLAIFPYAFWALVSPPVCAAECSLCGSSLCGCRHWGPVCIWDTHSTLELNEFAKEKASVLSNSLGLRHLCLRAGWVPDARKESQGSKGCWFQWLS